MPKLRNADERRPDMILLVIAIAFCVLLITVEIPAYMRMHDTTDLEIAILAALMLAGCIAVLHWGK